MQVRVDDAEDRDYLQDKLGIVVHPPCRLIAFFANSGRRLCCVMFNGYTGANIDMTVVAEKGGITRHVLRYLADYVFNKSGCRRVTVRTKARNWWVRSMAIRFGFVQECIAKHHFNDDDAAVFRMTRQECRYF